MGEWRSKVFLWNRAISVKIWLNSWNEAFEIKIDNAALGLKSLSATIPHVAIITRLQSLETSLSLMRRLKLKDYTIEEIAYLLQFREWIGDLTLFCFGAAVSGVDQSNCGFRPIASRDAFTLTPGKSQDISYFIVWLD